MASETPVPTREYPDDFEEVFDWIAGEITAATTRVVHSAEREIVVDSVWINCNVEDAPCTAQLFAGSYPTQISGSTTSFAVTGAANFEARTWVQVPITGDNVIPAGWSLNMRILVSTGLTDATIRIRYRSRRQ